MALEYKAILKLWKQFVCVATHFLVMSPIHVTFFDVIVHLIIMVNYSSLSYECLVFR